MVIGRVVIGEWGVLLRAVIGHWSLGNLKEWVAGDSCQWSVGQWVSGEWGVGKR